MPSNKEYYYHGSSQEQENDTFLNETTNLLANAGPPPPNREKSFSKIHNNLLISTIVFVGFIALVVSCFQVMVEDYRSSKINQLSPPSFIITQSPVTSKATSTFPEDFIWGASTSSYQIEGAYDVDGRGLSIWDTFCHNDPKHIVDRSNGDIACDHYHRVLSDVGLMVEMGIKAYRFSISWPRILPLGIVANNNKTQSGINQKGIDFYNFLIDTLLEHDIEPWATLHHWDLPQYLQDENEGWLGGKDTINAFKEYAKICFEMYGDRVKHWITINEAWTMSVIGYTNGEHAPGYVGFGEEQSRNTYLVGHHLLLAHAQVVQLYRNEFAGKQKGVIGISNSGDFRYPKDVQSKEDCEAAERAMEFQLGWFAEPIWGSEGDYPNSMRQILKDRLPSFTKEEKDLIRGSSDFFGLNHYSSLIASKPEILPSGGGYWSDMNVDMSLDPSWRRNDMGWSVVPDGLKQILKWIDQRYDHPLIYITENGDAESEPDLNSATHDFKRIDYLKGYLSAAKAAVVEYDVDLRGYFVWSFMDNFEWAFGYTRRFGLYHTNFDTMERSPKLSATWYKNIIENNGIEL